jgi:aminoglycoside 6-adenylyltransferase
MNSTTQTYEVLTEHITAWAQNEPDLRALAVIGSRARLADHPADEWSDLDLLVIVETPERYIGEAQWVAAFGEPWLTFVERTADGSNWERRVLFAGGLDVDFSLLPAKLARQMQPQYLPADALGLFRRGMRILVDKENLLKPVEEAIATLPAPTPPPPPGQHEYLDVVNDFWYHAVWSAKHLRRGELWWAKSGCDGRLKSLLQQMLEWHARTQYGASHDTWFRGRFLEEWIDPRARQALTYIFAHYEDRDIARALFATMELFRWLAIETGERLGYPYPADGDGQATQLAAQILVDYAL